MLILSSLLIASCSKEDAGDTLEMLNGFVLQATLDTSIVSTKTQHSYSNNRLKTSWRNGDEIALAGANSSILKFVQKGSIQDNGHSASFVCEETNDIPKGDVIAVYPYSSNLSFSLASQTGKISDLYNTDLLLSRANIESADNITLNFSPLCAIIRFPKDLRVSPLTSNGSIRIVFKGENVANGITISKSGGITPKIGDISFSANIINGRLTEDLYLSFIPKSLTGLYQYTLVSDKGDHYDFYKDGISTSKIYSFSDNYMFDGIIEFKNGAFREWCLDRFDFNNDGNISYSEARAVKRIHFNYGGGTMSQEDFAHFTNLRYLYVSAYWWENESLNFSHNEYLDTLIIKNAGVTSINFSNNKHLKYLSIDIHAFRDEIDLSNNIELRYLKVDAIASSLNISQNRLLDTLILSELWLNELDISNNTDLKYFSYSLAKGATRSIPIDFSKNTKLTYINCAGSHKEVWSAEEGRYITRTASGVTKLTLGKNNALDTLICNYNHLSELDVSGCSNIKYLNCNNGKLSSINVGNCSALTYLDCGSNQLYSIDVSQCPKLTELYAQYNELETLDMSKNNELTLLMCNNNNYLQSINLNGCVKLRDLRCWKNRLSDLNLVGCGTKSSDGTLRLTAWPCYPYQPSPLSHTSSVNMYYFESYQDKYGNTRYKTYELNYKSKTEEGGVTTYTF